MGHVCWHPALPMLTGCMLCNWAPILIMCHGPPPQSIIAVLNKLSKVALPSEIIRFIHDSTSNYGKVGSDC